MLAGEDLGVPLPPRNRLGLGHRNPRAEWEEVAVIDDAFLIRLGENLKVYSESMIVIIVSKHSPSHALLFTHSN